MNKVGRNRKGLVTVMVAGGVLASAGYAQADSAAEGGAAGSPGILSGNTVQVPVHIPVNVCGNTLNVVGLLNPAAGNSCANGAGSGSHAASGGAGCADASSASRSERPGHPVRPGRHAGGAADESAVPGGAHATDTAHGSPGVLSGNSLILPIDVPVNVSGNSVGVVGVGNPSLGNTSVNGETPQPAAAVPPPPAHAPVPAPPNERGLQDVADSTLAHTGADGVGWTAAGGAGLMLGGVILYRRFRPGRAA